MKLHLNGKHFLKSFADFIVRMRMAFFIVFLILMAASLVTMNWVELENDITVFLPDTSEAKQGVDLLNREFLLYDACDLMVENVTKDEANEIAEKLKDLDGVALVTFDETSAEHYQNHTARINISIQPGYQRTEVVSRAERFLRKHPYSLSYDNTLELADRIQSEMGGVIIIIALIILGVLLVTTDTFGEIIVLVGTFLAAALLNKGTNFLMGRIANSSDAISVVLQLALSVDYAIIFCNRYKECRLTDEPKQALANALAAAIPELFASSTTTVAGLLSITLMSFRLGADMGFVLIKAIICSMLAVFFFTPSLLILCNNLIERTRHKRILPDVRFIGKFAYTSRKVLPIIFIGLIFLSYFGYSRNEFAYTQELISTVKQSAADAGTQKVKETFGNNNRIVVIVPSGDYESEKALANDLSQCDEVKSTLGLAAYPVNETYALSDKLSYSEFAALGEMDLQTAQGLYAVYAANKGETDAIRTAEGLEEYRVPLIDLLILLHEKADSLSVDEEQIEQLNAIYDQLQVALDQLVGKNHAAILLYLDLPIQGDETFEFLDTVHAIAEQYYETEDVVLTGSSVNARDFKQSFEVDEITVSVVSIALVAIILFFTFKSLALPALLILIIQGSIWLNFSLPVLTGNYVLFMCYIVVSAIQMGANIDYAIVISSRYLEMRRKRGLEPREAIIETMQFSFPTLITSGSMMVLSGLSIWLMVSESVTAGVGHYVCTGTLITLLLVNFALPQMLVLFDRFFVDSPVRTALLAKRRTNVRWICAVALIVTSLLSLLIVPLSLSNTATSHQEKLATYEQMLDTTRQLRSIAVRLEADSDTYDSTTLEFAEHLLTDIIGTTELMEGEAQYDEGSSELSEGQAQYDEGYAQYAAAKATYDKGLAQYQSGYAQYQQAKAQLEQGKALLAQGEAQYQQGLAEYAAGQAQLEASKKQLEEGQKEYDAGAAELEAGKLQYNASVTLINTISPIYNTIAPLYENYQNLLAEYDKNPSPALWLRVTAAKLAFETDLSGTGYYSIGAMLEDLQNSEAELAEAQAQIESAEKQLADAKKQLDDGYAQYDAGEAKLNAAKIQLDDANRQRQEGQAEIDAGEEQLQAAARELEAAKAKLDSGSAQLRASKAQLDDAKDELDEGYDQLDEAKEQLDEGRKTLQDNEENLNSDLSNLDEYTEESEKLAAGIRMLLSVSEIADSVGRNASNVQICRTAEDTLTKLVKQMNKEYSSANLTLWLLLVTGTLLLAASVLIFLLPKYAIPLCAIAAVLALVSALVWKMACTSFSLYPFFGAIVIIAVIFICAEALIRLFYTPVADLVPME